jgi:hypothetical protein
MRATRFVHLIHLHFITVINVFKRANYAANPAPISPILLLLILSLNPNILPSAAFYLFT